MSKLRRFDLLRIAHLEVSEDLPQQEGILRNLPNNLEAGIPTIPNKDPWSCEEYTLNLNHSTWGYLKYNSFTPQKKPEEGRPKCAFSSPGPTFLRHFLVGQKGAQNKKHHTAVPQASQSVRLWRSDFGMAHNDASTLQFIETGQVLGAQSKGFPLWFQVSWEFKVPPPPPPRNKPLIRPY